jgi:hypothetical protein
MQPQRCRINPQTFAITLQQIPKHLKLTQSAFSKNTIPVAI